jgi:hypothetical protein
MPFTYPRPAVPSGMKWCPICDEVKSVNAFHKNPRQKSGLHVRCAKCKNKDGLTYYYKNQEKCIAWQRAFNKTPERQAYQRRYQRNRLRRVKDDLALRPRPLLCECCGEAPFGKNAVLSFDHCHATGSFRGWLCNRCNRVLGMCQDKASVLRALAAYMEKNDA